MSDESQEQETEIQENEVQDETVNSSNDDTNDSEVSESEEQTSVDSKEEEDEKLASSAELDAMSDEEFEEYLNSGKIPDKATETKAKIISKPETKTETTQPVDTQTPIDYKAAYESLFKPFKANGKEITPRTMEDIVSLMQMGANYTKKMQLMAPMKKAVESLNKASIGEDDLNFLIDVHKGDKEAIKSLLKKHNIDIIDLDLDNIEYTSNKRNIASDSDVEFSDTLLDVRDSLPKIQEIVNTKWDSKSKDALLADPKLMRALHEEIQLGRFDKVQAMVEEAKTFGKYKGNSDLEAYIDVVTRMVNEEQQKRTSSVVKSPETTTTTPKAKIPDKSKAAPTKGKVKSKSTLTANDLFSMSEEEFAKLSINDLV